VAAKIASIMDPDRDYKIMEVCGAHHIWHGIRIIAGRGRVVHGPGCPGLRAAVGRVDEGIEIAERRE